MSAPPSWNVTRAADGLAWHVAAPPRIHQYQIVLLPDGVFSSPDLARVGQEVNGSRRRVVVVDEHVCATIGEKKLRAYFAAHGTAILLEKVPAGEKSKTSRVADRVCAAVGEFGIHRRGEPIIAIGGGATLDVVGYVAYQYLRGVEWVGVGTSLVAMTDTLLGGKVAINDDQGRKNKRGGFWPATVRFIDPAFLLTLPAEMISDGAAEITKALLMLSAGQFARLAANAGELYTARFGGALGQEVISGVIDVVVPELARDLYEDNLARRLDFGHTLAHEIEATTQGALSHGRAVALDIAVSTELACREGDIAPDRRDAILGVLAAFRLPLWHSVLTDALFRAALAERTRHRGGELRMVLPQGDQGGTFRNDVSVPMLVAAAERLRQRQELSNRPAER